MGKQLSVPGSACALRNLEGEPVKKSEEPLAAVGSGESGKSKKRASFDCGGSSTPDRHEAATECCRDPPSVKSKCPAEQQTFRFDKIMYLIFIEDIGVENIVFILLLNTIENLRMKYHKL